MTDNDTHKWPNTLLEIMELNQRVLVAAGIPAAQSIELSQQLTREYARTFGGLQMYCPKQDKIEKTIRDRSIYHEYQTGKAAELARKYNLSEVQVYSIYKQQRALHQQKLQPQLL